MYVWLSIDDNLNVFENHCEIRTMDAPETNAQELNRRRTLVLQVVKAAHPELKGDECTRVQLALFTLVKNLPPAYEELDFAIHLGMAHHCLPEAQRSAREQTIDTIITTYCGPANARPAVIQPQLNAIRTQVILLPDALLPSHVGSHCGTLMMETVMNPRSATCDATTMRDLKTIARAVASASQRDGDLTSIVSGLNFIYGMSEPAQRKPLMDFVADPKSQRALPRLRQANSILLDRFPTIPPVEKARVLFSILLETAAAGACNDAQFNDIVQTQIVQESSRVDRTDRQIRNALMAAIRDGVPMGERGATTMRSLLRLRESEGELNIRLTPKAVERKTTAPTATRPQDGTTDMDPVHAWSVARLARWIEGPLAERSSQGRLDRQNVVARERTAIEQDAKERRDAGQKTIGIPAAITEDQVGQVMNDALAATARFFHDDIVDMAPLAKALGTSPSLIEACLALHPPLLALGNPPPDLDEEQARALLLDAETCIAELRKGIKATEASVQLARRFSTQLALALKAEALVLGKRHGGVIACPLRATDWAWVAQMFHRRWLPQITRLTIDGQSITLRPDQAVALYVTASSLSRHAFDVSVHLWQRRAGCAGEPSDLMDDCPPMNETRWFDTYVPCAVLHVPQAQ